MVNTILFDLDGTLLRMGQKEFLSAYISKLAKIFDRLGYEPKPGIDALWAGTYAMVKNDGSKLNKERFWNTFSKSLNLSEEDVVRAEAACDSFYTKEFDEVRAIAEPSDISAKLVKDMAKKGFQVVLATNPLFPECAVETRLSWINLCISDFSHVTHYGNSSFCKPSLGYYEQVLKIIDREPNECLMVGNNPSEDMIACSLGIEGFLVSGYVEGDPPSENFEYKEGTLEDLAGYFDSFSTNHT
ncbi:MAG: HAD family hydrolase [Oscillospiraceae bacterium]|nr:HAD family hydrolase [Oscillospiraceae bacterium]